MFASTNLMAASVNGVVIASQGAGKGAAGSSLSWTEDIPEGSGVTIVGVHSTAPTVTSVTVGGVAAQQVGAPFKYGSLYMHVFRLFNPPPGISQTINVTLPGNYVSGACSVSYFGAATVGAPQTATGSGTTASQSIASAPGQMIFQMFGHSGAAMMSNYSQTERFKVYSSGQSYSTLIGDAPGATTVNFNVTLGTSATWGAVAVPIYFDYPVVLNYVGGQGQGGNTFSWTDAIPSDATAAMATITLNRGTTPNYAYATLGGDRMNLLLAQDNAGHLSVLYGLLNPSTGSRAIQISYQTSVAFASFLTGAATYYMNAKAFGLPVGSNSASSLDVPVWPGGLAFGHWGYVNNFTPQMRHNIGTAAFVGYALTDGDATPAIDEDSVTIGAGGSDACTAISILNELPVGPRYDGMSFGYYPASTSGNLTFDHVASVGADVFFGIAVDRAVTVSNAKYDNVNATLVDTISFTGASGNGSLSVYRVTGVAGGQKAVTFNVSATATVAAGSVSLMNVSSVATGKTSGAASQPSHSVTCASNQIILEFIAMRAAAGTPSGGQPLWNGEGGIAALSLQQFISATSTTFSNSPTNVSGWGALGVIVS